MKIDSYSFGHITINGKRYNHDVVIYPDRVESWWREEGHKVSINDIKDALGKMPDTLIIGTGASGVMVVPLETKNHIDSQGIELIVLPTEAACQTYNQLSPTKRIIAAFHLTC